MKFKVGDRVRIVQKNNKKNGETTWNGENKMDVWCGKVVTINEISYDRWYRIKEDSYKWAWCDEMFENYTIQDGSMFDVKVGDVVIDGGGRERKVFEVLSNTFLPSNSYDHDTANGDWYGFKEAEKNGWKIKGKESDNVTVECEGKKTVLSRESAKTQGFI